MSKTGQNWSGNPYLEQIKMTVWERKWEC